MFSQYISYLINRKDEHSLHSPFVFELYTKVVQNKVKRPEYQAIEKVRKSLKKDKRIIEITDFGAGSKNNKSNLRSIASIAQNAEKPKKFAQLFFRLLEKFRYKIIVDLGTSLGVTTAYFASQNPDNQIISFEGCPEIAKIANENFSYLGLKNINLIVGNIDKTLQPQVDKLNKIDFAFFDANHRYEPTIRYFEICLAKAHEDSLFVFDDIYWSAEMTAAWQQIKQHPSVSVSIDLFFVGLIFFRKKQPKQAFVLKF